MIDVVQKPIVHENIGAISDVKIINKGKYNEREQFSYYIEIKGLKEDKLYSVQIKEVKEGI